MIAQLRILTHTEVSAKHLEEMTALLHILNPSLPPLTRERLDSLGIEGSIVLVADNNAGTIVGTATLIYYYQLAKGRVATIETVVVLSEYRRQGIGTALINRLLAISKLGGAANVSLTSNTTRESAHRLYEHLGFKKRDTYIFRIDLL